VAEYFDALALQADRMPAPDDASAEAGNEAAAMAAD